MSKLAYEDLIGKLVQELKPLPPLSHPFMRIAPWVVFTALYIFAAGLVHGYRTDISIKLFEFTFAFEVGLAVFISISAALASAWLCIPDARGRVWLAAAPLAGGGVFCLWCVLRLIREPFDYAYFVTGHCLGSCVLMGIIPGAFLCFMMRKGATTRPYLLTLLNTLSVGFAGYIGLRMTCPLDSVMDGTFHHFIPYFFLGLGSGAVAEKIYRW